MPTTRCERWAGSSAQGSHWFWYLAIGAGVLFLGAQTFQQIVMIVWSPEDNPGAASMLLSLSTPDRLRRLSLLVSFFFLPIFYLAIALVLGERRPAAAILAFVFSLLFVFCEVIQRAIDYFVVSLRWAAAFRSGNALQQQAILDSTTAWNEMVVALYFVLLMAHLIGSSCFLAAAWDRGNRWNVVLSLVIALNCIRLVGRVAEGYAGQAWLAPVNAAVYFPLTLVFFGTLSLWLFCRHPS